MVGAPGQGVRAIGTGRTMSADLHLEASCRGPVAGVDEVGRGPIAGPVFAAAVILNLAAIPEGLADSKRLSRKEREWLDTALRASGAHIGLAAASVAEIDDLNILAASLLAMRRAVARLRLAPGSALVDGIHAPDLPCPVRTVIAGDRLSASIAAASIIAKVARDRLMAKLAARYPAFGWEHNAGYGTDAHREAIGRVGTTRHHRDTFAPVRNFNAMA